MIRPDLRAAAGVVYGMFAGACFWLLLYLALAAL